MSNETLNRTSIADNFNKKETPKKVNIDVLKRRIYEQEKKDKIYGRVIVIALLSFVCVLGFFISA